MVPYHTGPSNSNYGECIARTINIVAFGNAGYNVGAISCTWSLLFWPTMA